MKLPPAEIESAGELSMLTGNRRQSKPVLIVCLPRSIVIAAAYSSFLLPLPLELIEVPTYSVATTGVSGSPR